MKLQALCRRTTWEIVRDPLNLAFGLGFPLVLLLLLSAIQTNVPVDLFAIDRLTPGITVFGLAFVALFSATLVSRDRESALLQRLYTAPLTAGDFIFGYVLPLAPMAAVQAAVCYLAAIPLGLTVLVRMLWAVLLDLPAALLFIGLGLLCGSVMNVKQVGGICAGAAYTMVRKLGEAGEKGPVIVLFFSVFSCVVVLPWLIFDYHPMTWQQMGILLLAGCAAAGGQFAITAAYRYAPASRISIYDYSQLIFSTMLGFFIFGQVPDGWSFLGYGIICLMAIFMFVYNNRKRKNTQKQALLESKEPSDVIKM